MTYNFTNIFDDIESSFDEFTNNHAIDILIDELTETKSTTAYYQAIFNLFNGSFEESQLLETFQELTKHKISIETPYGIMSNEIYSLKNLLISNAIEKNMTTEVISIFKLFKDITNSVAQLYLTQYLDRLISLNSVRRNSLSDLNEKNLIIHYEAHLAWLSNLAEHIKTKDKSKFPQLDHTLCAFGEWLHGSGKQVIQNNSKYKSLQKIHEKLHLFAHKIYNILEKPEYNFLITYLEKCELISLGIGTELALLDQIIINKKITKDTLTGALNRHALKDLFESQYELALATNNPFIFALCDLDHFKNINDTYGHVAGDKLLKLFVLTVKKNIRNSDMVIRYGGEEFVIMLPTVNKNNGYKILETIREAFEASVLEFNEQKIQATVSIGMMEISPQQLFKQSFLDEYIMIVDQNLYMAKKGGRNRIEIYE